MFCLQLLEGISVNLTRTRNEAILWVAKNLSGKLQAYTSVGTSNEVDVIIWHRLVSDEGHSEENEIARTRSRFSLGYVTRFALEACTVAPHAYVRHHLHARESLPFYPDSKFYKPFTDSKIKREKQRND